MDIDCICQCSEFKCDSEFEHLAKNPKNNIYYINDNTIKHEHQDFIL